MQKLVSMNIQMVVFVSVHVSLPPFFYFLNSGTIQELVNCSIKWNVKVGNDVDWTERTRQRFRDRIRGAVRSESLNVGSKNLLSLGGGKDLRAACIAINLQQY